MTPWKTLGLALVLSLCSLTTFAQRGGGNRNLVTELKAELNLSDEQVTQLKEVHQKFQPQFQALRQDASMSRQAKMEKMKVLRDQEEAQIKALLTDEQYATYTEKMAERRAERRERRQ
ncbi:hypothetical protein SAMN05421823_111141 [Catalinimonas alkaloidigena]|uniref:LTXXQ motif family protein n=1 Tax=Catalinimonas alkaloidigena TaxID=1075417 RepID=A0A1G9RFB1_9BACT|nr:hypothetical protein [Catalinimonas alkaloidigena]SDM22009.1 hypothetical protein SAMN05421823_111141 [Catalinimonas alkaloidigena]